MDLKLWRIKIIFSMLQRINFWVLPITFVKRNTPVRLLKENLSFYIGNMRDTYVLNEVIFDDKYQQYRRVKKGDVVVDIGTGLGDFSIFVADKAKRVVGFDPDHYRMGLAKKNIKLNNRINIELVEEAVHSLDKAFSKYKIIRCDFLKMDCEGGEYEIFSNASPETFAKIRYIAMEAHIFDPSMNTDYMKLKKILKKNHFTVIEEKSKYFPFLRFIYAEKK